MEIADDEVVPIKELVELYESVGWLLYAADPDALARAVDRSTYVVTARDDDGRLIGLARGLTDEVSVLYLREVLVHPAHHRAGVGTALVTRCLDTYGGVAQKVALTGREPEHRAFARAVGFVAADDERGGGYQAFVRPLL